MEKYTIIATVLFEKNLWVAIFERKTSKQLAVAKQIFGKEPTDAELYNFVLTHYDQLKFSAPQAFTLVIKRKNPKRVKREVKREVEKLKKDAKPISHAQDVLRLELEKNKKLKKIRSKAEKELAEKNRFIQKQQKKKQKLKGH